MNIITLFRDKDSIMAEYSGPHKKDIISLFGTNILPTAFKAHTGDECVLKAIQQRNPNTKVVWRDN
jgi:hypothetical protein